MASHVEQVYKELADEHESIMQLLDRIQQHGTVLHLVPLLEELHAVLIKHFAHEQFPGGLYESLGAYGPEYHDDLRVLVNEHCWILSSVRGVLERARLANEDNAEDILRDVASIVQSLHEHERKEHQLAEKILCQ